MARLAITGASGYIGKRFHAMAREHGHTLVVLGRKPVSDGDIFHAWSLGESVSPGALTGCDAVIHLAHAWHGQPEGADPNGAASEMLARQALSEGVPRFVFASSTSARPTALNAYGRIKHETENRLAALPDASGRIVSARIALVYGGPPAGQYAMMRAVTRVTPVLPMFGLDREVQPIYLDEVCVALLTLATNTSLNADCYVVASDQAITFAHWLKILRKAQTGMGLLLIPIPLKFMLLLCDLMQHVPALPKIDRERVLGLAAASPMASTESLKALALAPADPLATLLNEERIALGGEARALLRYLGARSMPAMEHDLTAGLKSAGLSPLGLSPMVLRHPFLIAFREPRANCRTSRLGQALCLTSQVMEAHAPHPPERSFLRAAALVTLDLLLLPARLLFGGRQP